MRTITARNPHDSLSFSRRHFKWPVLGKSYSHGATRGEEDCMKSSEAEEEEDEATMAFSSVCPSFHSEDFVSPPKKPPRQQHPQQQQQQHPPQRRKVRTAVSRLRSALAAASCGYAVRRECGAADWRVLRALEPVSMGAGVIPAASCGGGEGDVMYMRARFERVVGSRDSEAFYMMNPDSTSTSSNSNSGGPELSVYLLRV
uniref:Protein MIZU-KUSSEI 1 n=1 Tax=Oryza barthii TaxID=65489 RepID=A0A0D3GB65_9ORYZ